MADRVPPLAEELAPAPDPVRCCELLSGLPYRLFLDSAANGTRLGRYSLLTADPIAVVRSKGLRTELPCAQHLVAGKADLSVKFTSQMSLGFTAGTQHDLLTRRRMHSAAVQLFVKTVD